jgi:hypothetical protein
MNGNLHCYSCHGSGCQFPCRACGGTGLPPATSPSGGHAEERAATRAEREALAQIRDAAADDHNSAADLAQIVYSTLDQTFGPAWQDARP